MADDQTIDYSALTPEIVNGLIARATAPLPNVQVDQTPVDTSGFWGGLRHGISLLGEFAGSPGPEVLKALSPAEREQAGFQALSRFGTGLMAASHYVPGQTLGSNLAQGFQAAEHGYDQTARQAMGLLGARQDYAVQQQQADLAKLKEVIPLLQMKARLDAAGQLQNPLTAGRGTAPAPATSIATGGSIAPFVATNLPEGVSTGEDQIVRTVIGEAGNQPLPGQQGVAAVIKNRMEAGKQNAQDVIFAPNQFDPWNNAKTRAGLETIDPSSKQYQDVLNNVVRPVMSGSAKDPTGGATHFYSPTAQAALGRETPSWAQGQQPTVIGQHNFYKLPYGGSPSSTPTPAPGQATAPPMAPVGTQPPNTPVQIPPAAPPAPVQVAGPGAGAPPGQAATSPPVAPPAPPPPLGPLEAPSREAFRATHPFQPPPDQVKTFNTEVDPRTEAGMARQEQNAQNLVQQLTQQYHATGDVKLLADIATATDKYNSVVSQNGTTRQAAIEKGHAAYNAALAAHLKSLDDSYDKAHELAQTHANQLDQSMVAADITTGQKDVETASTDANLARRVLPVLMSMGPQLENLPNGVVGGLLAKYPELVPILQAGKVVDPAQATNVQLLQSARAYLSLLQKPVGSGSLRIPEMDNLASYTPGTLNTPQARQEMLGRLIALNQRVIAEHNFTSQYFGRPDPKTPGKLIYNTRGLEAAMNGPLKLDANGHPTADSGLGPVVPVPPPLPAGQPTADQVAAHTAYNKYIQNVLPDNSPYLTYRQRTDKTTGALVNDRNGNPVMDRVQRIKGVNDIGK